MVFGAERTRVGFFHDVGTGKTPLALMLQQVWGAGRTLVVAPSSAYSAWERDAKAFTDWKIAFATGTKKERQKVFNSSAKLVVINYEGLKSIYGHRVPTLDKMTGRMVKKHKLNPVAINTYRFDSLILDEVHRCKAWDSLQSAICYEISLRTKYTIGMTGTPIDDCMLELFNIMKAIDHGDSLGTNFFSYCLKYFHKGFFGWELTKGADIRILKAIEKNVIRFEDVECLDMPITVEQVIECTPTPEFLRLQRQLIKEGWFDYNDQRVSSDGQPTKRANLLKGLASGFFYWTDEAGEKHTTLLDNNPKAEMLTDLILDTGRKLITFYHWQGENDVLRRALKKKKIQFVSIHGGQTKNERDHVIHRFQTDPKCLSMIAQDGCGREGFDATASNMVAFFSPVGSPLIRKQCVGRVRRNGQEADRCYVYDMVLKNSPDKMMIKNRGDRFSFVASMMEYMRDYGKQHG